MSAIEIVALIVGALVLIGVLLSYAGRFLTERARARAEIEVEAQDHRLTANARRRHAKNLAAEATKVEKEARELDERAAREVEAARLSEERVIEADRKLKRADRRFPIRLLGRDR